MKNKGWTFLLHHRLLLEYCHDYKGRVDWIKKYKPVEEQPTRLAAFRFVKGELPDKLLEAWEALKKAGKAYEKAGEARDKAWAVYWMVSATGATGKAWAAYEAFDKAWETRKKTWEACQKAGAACQKAYEETYPEILALFRKECPETNWDEKNKTLVFD